MFWLLVCGVVLVFLNSEWLVMVGVLVSMLVVISFCVMCVVLLVLNIFIVV